VLKQPEDDRPLVGDVLKEPAQPGREPVSRAVTLDYRGGGADLIDLIDKQCLQEFAAGREVAVQGCLTDPGSPGDLGH
jgi:hypothetical protein